MPYLQRRRCLFGHSAGEVAAATLVGSEAPRSDVLELAAEVQGLRRVLQRLAGTILWDSANPDATAVAKLIVEAQPLEIAQDKALTETVCANAAATAVEGTVVQARPLGIAQYSALTESEIAVSSGEAGSY